MALTSHGAPLILAGRPLTGPLVSGGAYATDYNPDHGPSAFGSVGWGLLDPRNGYSGGVATGVGGSTAAFVFYDAAQLLCIDQAPSTAAVNNLAAAAHPASGVAMTLRAATGSGITVMTAALAMPDSLNTVPISRAIDGLPTWISYGQNGAIQVRDPAKQIARLISITDTSASGGAFKIVGYDVWGNIIHETLTQAGSSATTNSAKAYKFVLSVTPQFTESANYSVGVADTIGLPIRADAWFYVRAAMNDAMLTASTGFTAADTTTATATTGDVRGLYALQTSADGTKKVQLSVAVAPANAGTLAGLFGVTQF